MGSQQQQQQRQRCWSKVRLRHQKTGVEEDTTEAGCREGREEDFDWTEEE